MENLFKVDDIKVDMPSKVLSDNVAKIAVIGVGGCRLAAQPVAACRWRGAAVGVCQGKTFEKRLCGRVDCRGACRHVPGGQTLYQRGYVCKAHRGRCADIHPYICRQPDSSRQIVLSRFRRAQFRVAESVVLP